jgi:hypothetical protein
LTDSAYRATPYRLLLILIVLGLAPVLLMMGSAAWFRAYVQGDDFLRSLNEETSAALGVDGSYAELVWQGSTVRSERFHGVGLPGSPVREVTAEGLRGVVRLPGLLRWNWRLQELEIREVRVRLSGVPTPAAAVPTPRLLAAALGPAPAAEPGPFGYAVVRSLTADWDLRDPGPGALRNTQLEVESDGRDRIRIRAAGGTVTQTGMGEAALDILRVEYEIPTAELKLREARLVPSVGGGIQVRGEAGPWVGATPAMRCQIDFDGIPIAAWLQPDWQQRVLGTLQGQATLRGSPAVPGGITGQGTIRLVDGLVQRLPLLEQIAILTGEEGLRRIPLHTVEAELHFADGRLTADPVLAESTGLVRLEGAASTEGGTISGRFRVGVSEQGLRWLPGAREQVFTEADGEYHWTTVRVAGPLDQPQEDLSPRLLAAARQGVVRKLEQGAEAAVDFLRDLLR